MYVESNISMLLDVVSLIKTIPWLSGTTTETLSICILRGLFCARSEHDYTVKYASSRITMLKVRAPITNRIPKRKIALKRDSHR